MTENIRALFARAGCTGQLCVQSLDGEREVAVDADQPAVSASVFKVLVALAAETRFADGTLDPAERVTLPGSDPVPGPVGFSLYRGDVQVSLGDLVIPMLTISDNVATDALLHTLGVDAVNVRAGQLGLAGTVITSDLCTMIDSFGQQAGFAGWNAMWDWAARPENKEAARRLRRDLRAADALNPAQGIRTTPRDMALLLRLIWTDQAGPPSACGRVRQLMRGQLTRNRLAAGFGPPARVAAKSGSLLGVVRNEVGVIEYPGGEAYVAAVFTRAGGLTQTGDESDERPVNAAIGQAAAAAVSRLRGR